MSSDLSEMPFQNLGNDELLNSVIHNETVEFTRYNYIKFDVVEYNAYLENTGNHCIYVGSLAENECKYVDVEDQLKKRKSLQTLTTIFQNIRSISKNLNEFSNNFSFDDSEYDLLCFVETRLTKDSSTFFKMSTYEMYSNSVMPKVEALQFNPFPPSVPHGIV